jgi:restriction system protein
MIRVRPNSLFAVLLRNPWWVSASIGTAIGLLAAALVPDDWRAAALLAGLPFLVIAGIAGLRGYGAPGAAEIERTAQTVRALAWPAFAEQLNEAFARDGWTVQRIEARSHDFVLERGGKRLLVAARRWKSAHLGLEPLRALQGAREAGDGADALCIALGELSDPARQFAAAQGIALWQAAELAQALRRKRLG